MNPSVLLQSFEGTNKEAPVWFMRQAGRYLPEYQAIKQKYSLEEMFSTPELAAEITCLPIEILGVDAAILFADILTLPSQMGFDIGFDNQTGPAIDNLIKTDNIDFIHDFDNLDYVFETIKLVNQKLPSNIPLIGFAGSPFTVLTYLIEGGSSVNFSQTFQFIAEHEDVFHRLMDKVTKNTISYLNRQKDAGIKVFQLFDTWAGILRPADYAHWVLPYVSRIFKQVDLPSIYYVKNCYHLLNLIDRTDADFLSVCHNIVLGHNFTVEHTKKGIQGNLFNGILFADDKIIKREVKDVLVGAQKHDRYIFNLSHGVLPQTDVYKLKKVVELIREFKWKN